MNLNHVFYGGDPKLLTGSVFISQKHSTLLIIRLLPGLLNSRSTHCNHGGTAPALMGLYPIHPSRRCCSLVLFDYHRPTTTTTTDIPKLCSQQHCIKSLFSSIDIRCFDPRVLMAKQQTPQQLPTVGRLVHSQSYQSMLWMILLLLLPSSRRFHPVWHSETQCASLRFFERCELTV